MDKRTRILLIVVGALIVLGGGYFGYITMTAKEVLQVAKVTPPKQPAPPVAPTAAQPAVPPVATQNTPVPAAPSPAKTEAVPVSTTRAKTQATPVPTAAAKAAPPSKTQPAPSPAKTQATPVPTVAAKAAPPSKTQPAPVAATYTPVIKAMEKGKPVEYKSPEELLAKTAMSPAEVKDFSRRSLDESKKAYDDAVKKGDKDAKDRADKDLKLMDRLSSVVAAKFPAPAGAETGKSTVYSSLSKRDPFMSPLQIPKVYPPVLPDAGPLERKPAEEMVVQAVMWTDNGYRALILTPDDRGYTVKVGDILGNKRGKVVKITRDRVYVVEMIKDILGDVHKIEHTLKLHKEAE